jgi:hypothetical protein
MDIQTIATWAAAATSIIALCAWLRKFALNAVKELKRLQSYDEEMDALKADMGALRASVAEIKDSAGIRRKALMAVLSNSIARAHREFMSLGKIDTYCLKSVIEMHEFGKALGNDGLQDHLVDELKTLKKVIEFGPPDGGKEGARGGSRPN